jgi:hypothetical protein
METPLSLLTKTGFHDSNRRSLLTEFNSVLKVLTNEKRGGLNLVSFDWSRFQFFMLKLSKESVQTLSCERPETSQRTLFLSFEINNCFPITVQCRAASRFSHHTLN